jgi:hypothetical protein
MLSTVNALALAPRPEERDPDHRPTEEDVARWAVIHEALPEGVCAGIDDIGRELAGTSRAR